ncbi:MULTISPECIES: hypothetical protein [unclassified Pedobacter]|uniref:hypothetical protein n=1 Tax=unclassified Pedobacter TaxID=2628915 RepID=UPI00141E52A9|nr:MULTISPECIES: hypothetical protein [unclassified Pedobacter]NII83491.1 hypothetical protein [Pedobacter sp. SG908]NMN37355.1 hypothetical protein [Pedobacter sp. SG918]
MKEKILIKLDKLIHEATNLLENLKMANFNKAMEEPKFSAFRTSALSFLKSMFGEEHYYHKFNSGVKYYADYNVVLAIELLKKIKNDVEEGWLDNLRGLVSAELFSDFLDMAEHLTEEGYKDPAAVIIGSVLEENLRQLSLKSGLPITQTDTKSGKVKPMKAESMNIELAKNNIYNLTYQKLITGWLDLRNKAAHGLYSEYDSNIVVSFLLFVRDFSAKFN